jgi:hypothetical protein
MRGRSVTTVEVVEYVKSVFDDGVVLDGVPGSAAGNMAAWKAWRDRSGSGVWAEKAQVAVRGSGGEGVLYSSVAGEEPVSFGGVIPRGGEGLTRCRSDFWTLRKGSRRLLYKAWRRAVEKVDACYICIIHLLHRWWTYVSVLLLVW